MRLKWRGRASDWSSRGGWLLGHLRRHEWLLATVMLIGIGCSSGGGGLPTEESAGHPAVSVSRDELPNQEAGAQPMATLSADELVKPVSGAQPPVQTPQPTLAAPQPTATVAPLGDFSLHLPPEALARQPLGLVVALHGMGGNGGDFSRRLVEHADRHGWVVLAPTMKYRDWRDPEQVRRDEAELLPALKTTLDDLPNRTGLALRRRALVYGFSRGAQIAHRFCFFYPASCRGVAIASAGTYTLPKRRATAGSESAPLSLPYGAYDLERYGGQPFDPANIREIDFWIGVGGRDNLPEDVPREWDPFIGDDRVERAQAFSRSLEEIGARVRLDVFPAATHEVTAEMRNQAMAFLGQLTP